MLNVSIQSFAYQEAIILKEIDFQLDKGSQLVVLGESGCGKSTLLHLVYGLLDLDHGTMTWDDTKILGPKFTLVPGMPFMKLVAQEYNVMPYTTVAENVAEFLSRRDLSADRARVMELLEVVDLVAFADIKVKVLSGGQKQRVALAKALANEPELLLLDEPFSHIDTFRKNALRRNLYAYLRAKNISCITATHDPSEALSFADDILMLHKNGTVQAYGSPQKIYSAKNSLYQSGFFDEVSLINETPYYPHELEVTSGEGFEVIVKGSYFKGSHYLIHAINKDESVYFNANQAWEAGTQITITPKIATDGDH